MPGAGKIKTLNVEIDGTTQRVTTDETIICSWVQLQMKTGDVGHTVWGDSTANQATPIGCYIPTGTQQPTTIPGPIKLSDIYLDGATIGDFVNINYLEDPT